MRARTKPKDLAYKLTQISSTVNPSLICVHPKASWSVPGESSRRDIICFISLDSRPRRLLI